MKRGSIILTKFPFTDLSAEKRRPGIVVSASVNQQNDIIVAFISSIVPPASNPTDYILSQNHQDFAISGLKKDSVIKADKLATINLSIVSGEMGYVSAPTLKEIDARLKIALGLPK